MTKCFNCCGLETDADICPNCGHSLTDFKALWSEYHHHIPAHVTFIGGDYAGFNTVGPLKYQTSALLSYAINRDYVQEALNHPTIAGLFCRAEDAPAASDFTLLVSEDPAMDFYKFHNYLVMTEFYGPDVYPLAINHTFFAARGIIISPGVVIGVDGGRIYKGLRILHGGGVEIGDGAFIGANTVIVRGVWGNNTKIGKNCFIGQLCSIGHNTVIGDNCLILPKVTICGSCEIGNDVRISPGAIVSDHITIGDGAYITLGAVVTKDVGPGEHVSGNFAIRHENWLAFVKGLAGRE